MSFIAGYLLGRAGKPDKVSDKLKIISESKTLLTIPVDDVFHLTVHALYSEDSMFLEQYGSGWGQIFSYTESGLSGGFIYPVYRKCFTVWMVCWKNDVPQYATLLGYDSKFDSTSSWFFYADDNVHYYNALYYDQYYRPILESIDGGGGGVFDFDTGNRFSGYWNGNILAFMTFLEESYTYEPTPDNIGIGSLKMTGWTETSAQINVSQFNVVPAYNGTVTHLPFEKLKTLVEDLCIAILNVNGFKGERLTVLKPD